MAYTVHIASVESKLYVYSYSVTKILLTDEKYNSTMNSSIMASPPCGYVHTTFA